MEHAVLHLLVTAHPGYARHTSGVAVRRIVVVRGRVANMVTG